MEPMSAITANVKAILAGLPPGVELVAAAKTRTAAEILEAVEAGVQTIGENYVQEAAEIFPAVGRRARWHLIGHLQTNKAKRAVEIFDLVETVDSIGLGSLIASVTSGSTTTSPAAGRLASTAPVLRRPRPPR